VFPVRGERKHAMSNHSPPLRSTVSLCAKTNLVMSKKDGASKKTEMTEWI